ncbi:MAG: site-specific integrase [Candidatus Alectryocaccobium sp.]
MIIPKPRKLPSGQWNIELQIDGKRRSITAATKKECFNAASLIKAEYLNGIRSTSPTTITLRKAIDNYISMRSNVLSPSTIKGYRAIQACRFSTVMDKRISEIRNWQALVNNEAALCSAKTLKNAWGFIRSVLKESDADPGVITLPQIIPKEQPFLDPDQIRFFLDAIRGDYYEVAFLLALHSLRRSEIFGLKRKDITDKVIKVHGSTVQGTGGRFVDKPTNKNSSSRRNVPILIPRLLELLPENPDTYVVPRSPNDIIKHLRSVCSQNNLPSVGLHGLRHSFASLCYHLGLSEKMTMRFGGWSDPGVMRRIYTHLANTDINEAYRTLQSFFNDSEKNPNENPNEIQNFPYLRAL